MVYSLSYVSTGESSIWKNPELLKFKSLNLLFANKSFIISSLMISCPKMKLNKSEKL